MVYIDYLGEVKPLYLKDLQDPTTGKIPPRGVDMQSAKVRMVFNNLLHYITKADYVAAMAYVDTPEDYDFYKILGWE
jgi:6-phosphofructokinase 1